MFEEQLNLFDIVEAQTSEKFVRRISYDETKPFLLNIHYARRMPCITDAFGLFVNGELVGVVTYGVPASRPLCIGLAGVENERHVLELNRLCIRPDLNGGGRNYASYLVSRSLKMLPNGTFVVSYADTAWTHVGYIYQACNFLYTGLSAKRKDTYQPGGATPPCIRQKQSQRLVSDTLAKAPICVFGGGQAHKKTHEGAVKISCVRPLPQRKRTALRHSKPANRTRDTDCAKKGRCNSILKNTNPRRIPRTEADVERAYKRGQTETIEFACAVACISLHDVFEPDAETMQKFNQKFNQTVSAILNGEVKYQDIVNALKEEYGLEMEFR